MWVKLWKKVRISRKFRLVHQINRPILNLQILIFFPHIKQFIYSKVKTNIVATMKYRYLFLTKRNQKNITKQQLIFWKNERTRKYPCKNRNMEFQIKVLTRHEKIMAEFDKPGPNLLNGRCKIRMRSWKKFSENC